MNLKSGLYRLVRARLTYRCRGAVRIAVYSRELDLDDFYGAAALMLLVMAILAPLIIIAGLVRCVWMRPVGDPTSVAVYIWDVVRWVWSLPMEGAQLDHYLWDDVHGRLDRL